MLSPFIIFICDILSLYQMCIIAWTIISTLISFKIINAYQPFVIRLMQALDRICEPALKPIRKLLPDLGGFDISPIILILLIGFVQNCLVTYSSPLLYR